MLFKTLPAGIRGTENGARPGSFPMLIQMALRKDLLAVISLAVIWGLTEILIHPAGNFPLNDDWSYSLSLQEWFGNHHYHLQGWTSMPLLSQLTWGLLFCKIFGFSFTVLRYSTLVLGLAGGIGAYFLSREFSGNRGACFLAALILLLNPIYLNLSNTFMTDVPFTSFLIFALLFFVKGLRHDKAVYILQGIFFVLVATLVRQLGLLAAGAFAVTLVLKDHFSRKSLVLAVISVGLPAGIYLLYNHWLKTDHDYPVKYDEGLHRMRHNIFGKGHSTPLYLFRQALNLFIYSGSFIFPFIFRMDWKAIWDRRRSMAFIAALAVMAVMGIYCLIYRNDLSLMGNIIHPYGLGAIDLRDGNILHTGNLTPLPAVLWQLICIAGVVGSGMLVWTITQCFRDLRSRPALLFLLGFAILYSFIMMVGGTYDRYLIPLIPILVILLMTGLGKQRAFGRWAALASLLVIAWLSIAGTANYFSWNRARWDALHYLTDEKEVSPAAIDGGFAFNGYYNYNDADITGLKDHPGPGSKSWWWVQDDAYMISFGPLEGYAVLKIYPCGSTLFPSSIKSVYLLKRAE
jgi:hypothetical protein